MYSKDLIRLLLHHSTNIHDMTEKLELDKHLLTVHTLRKMDKPGQSIDLNYFRMRNFSNRRISSPEKYPSLLLRQKS